MTTFVENPFGGCHQALIIAGSDKRGAIFGVYALSEQIGVSPYSPFPQLPHLCFECKLRLTKVVLVG